MNAMPPRQRHWGGNHGAHWSRKTVAGVQIQTCDPLLPDDRAVKLDITIVTEPVSRRYELEPIDLPPRPGARRRLWGLK